MEYLEKRYKTKRCDELKYIIRTSHIHKLTKPHHTFELNASLYV